MMNIQFRKATRQDVPRIVQLLAEDDIGQKREQYKDPLPPSYYHAFDVIDADPQHHLIVAELNNEIIGTLQLTYLTHMTYQGGKRAQIEGVRTAASVRGKGIGKAMLLWAIEKAKQDHCHLVQLTTDKRRTDALAFYEKLGFVVSHEGLKLHF